MSFVHDLREDGDAAVLAAAAVTTSAATPAELPGVAELQSIDGTPDSAATVPGVHDLHLPEGKRLAVVPDATSKAYAESIVATVREPMLILDSALCVVTANRAFLRAFRTVAPLTEHASLYELAGNHWNIAELRRLLEEVLPERTTVEAFEVRDDFGDGERSLLLNARRLRQEHGMEPLILLAFEDVTERRRAEREITRLASIVDSSDDAIISKDLDGVVTSWNKAAERMFGYLAREAVGHSIASLIIPADRQDEEDGILRRLRRGETVDHFETVRRRKDDSQLEVSVTISPLRDKQGRIIGASKIARDITERKRHEEHRELLIHELNHRVKNTLASVQALAMQTFRGPEMHSAMATFEARLLAMSAAHDVLTGGNWKGAGIREIVRNAIAAWTTSPDARIGVEGPELRLRPAAALALAMALHELATNAAKYGALSTNKAGKVAIAWSVSGDAVAATFRLHWRESGGPRVRPPARRGFGFRLVEYGLAQDLGGTVVLSFPDDGVECRVEAPLDEIREQDAVA